MEQIQVSLEKFGTLADPKHHGHSEVQNFSDVSFSGDKRLNTTMPICVLLTKIFILIFWLQVKSPQVNPDIFEGQ
jgi:hypothetical protein